MRFESLVEGAEDEAARLWRVVVLGEVRQRSAGKAEGTSLAVDVLVAQAEHDLGEVGLGALGLRSDHLEDGVEVGRHLLRHDLLHGGQPVVQVGVYVVFERVSHPLAPLVQVFLVDAQLVPVLIQHSVVKTVDLLYLFLDAPLNLLVGDAVGCAHCERASNEPVVDDALGSGHELVGGVRADLEPDGVDQPSRTRTHYLFLQCPRQQLSLADYHGGVIAVPQAVLAFPDLNGDFFGDDHAHDLLAGPEGFGFEDGGDGEFPGLQLVVALPPLLAVDPDHQVHHLLTSQEGVSHREQVDAEECVLDQPHDGSVILGCHDLLGDVRDVLELGSGLVGLGDVHVHLVPVEVGVVGGADRQVQPESVVGQNAHAVSHHTHPMQRRLPVEQHVVAILKVAFHDGAVVDYLSDFLGFVVDLHQIHDFLVLPPVLGRLDYVLDLALEAELDHAVVVVLSDFFGDGELGRYLLRHPQLVEGQVGVGTDHTPGREIDSFSHEVLPEASLLRLEPLLYTLDLLHGLLLLAARLLQVHSVHLHHDRSDDLFHLSHLVQPLGGVRVGLQLVVDRDDPNVSAGDFILGLLLRVHLDGRADLRRRHCQRRNYEIYGF